MPKIIRQVADKTAQCKKYIYIPNGKRLRISLFKEYLNLVNGRQQLNSVKQLRLSYEYSPRIMKSRV